MIQQSQHVARPARCNPHHDLAGAQRNSPRAARVRALAASRASPSPDRDGVASRSKPLGGIGYGPITRRVIIPELDDLARGDGGADEALASRQWLVVFEVPLLAHQGRVRRKGGQARRKASRRRARMRAVHERVVFRLGSSRQGGRRLRLPDREELLCDVRRRATQGPRCGRHRLCARPVRVRTWWGAGRSGEREWRPGSRSKELDLTIANERSARHAAAIRSSARGRRTRQRTADTRRVLRRRGPVVRSRYPARRTT